MPTFFCVTIRFLQPYYHGRADRGRPEWPPSPLRVFQALVAAAAARWDERSHLTHAAPALSWLERQPTPSIIAPVGEPARSGYRLYVPDNVADKVAGSWSRGGAASIAAYRVAKDVKPTHIRGVGAAINYLWPIPIDASEFERHREVLMAAARSVSHLGWGIDMVASDASVVTDAESNKLVGERWIPSEAASVVKLRVPVAGTLSELIAKHKAFLQKSGIEGPSAVAPLSAFGVVGYHRATDLPSRSVELFKLMKPDASGFRPFDPARQGMIVAGMVRHAAGRLDLAHILGWSPEKVGSFVLGHGEAPGQPHEPVTGSRLAYIPLPSIEPRGNGRAEVVGSIRRVLLTVFGSHQSEDLHEVTRLLAGIELIGEGEKEKVASLFPMPESDGVARRYLDSATTWATVTPMILPGYDDPRQHRKQLFPKSQGAPHTHTEEQRNLLDKLDRRIDHLIRKAIRQAGYPEELARFARIEWRTAGFWPGTELATNYDFPRKLRRFRRLHVRITWQDADGNSISLPGPICLGGGRFNGLGLFAAMS